MAEYVSHSDSILLQIASERRFDPHMLPWQAKCTISHLAEKPTISYGKNIEVMFAAIRYIVIAGNALFILWITVNGIDEGFSGTIIQKVSYISLIALLVLNIALLWRTRQKPS